MVTINQPISFALRAATFTRAGNTNKQNCPTRVVTYLSEKMFELQLGTTIAPQLLFKERHSYYLNKSDTLKNSYGAIFCTQELTKHIQNINTHNTIHMYCNKYT